MISALSPTKTRTATSFSPRSASPTPAVFGSGDKVVPYAGLSADIYIANIQSARNGFDIKSGLRSGFGGTAFAGLNFGRIAYLQARYNAVTKLSGLDLSGLSLTTGVRFRF